MKISLRDPDLTTFTIQDHISEFSTTHHKTGCKGDNVTNQSSPKKELLQYIISKYDSFFRVDMSDMNPLHNTYNVGLGKYRVCNFQLAYIHHLPLSCMMPVVYYSCMHSFVDHWMETKWLLLCMFQVGLSIHA